MARLRLRFLRGSVGDAYDRASGRHWFKTTGEGFGRNNQPFQGLRGPIGGHGPLHIYKTEVIRRRSSWKTMEEVELETLKWPYGDPSIAYRLIGRLVQQQAPA